MSFGSEILIIHNCAEADLYANSFRLDLGKYGFRMEKTITTNNALPKAAYSFCFLCSFIFFKYSDPFKYS